MPWRDDKTASRNLRRFGQYQMGLQVLLALTGLIYCLAAAVMDGPIMDPADYGPYVTAVKAEVWAWPIFLSSLIYILGIKINGHWRWSPALRLFGATVHSVTLTLFTTFSAEMAIKGASVDPFIVTCLILASVNTWYVFLNASDLARSIKGK